MRIKTHKKLVHCPEIKTKYKEKLEEKLNNQTDKPLKNNSKVIKETAKEEIGLMKPTQNKTIKRYNDKIEFISKGQKKIRSSIENSKNMENIIELKKKRNNIQKAIKRGQRQIKMQQMK